MSKDIKFTPQTFLDIIRDFRLVAFKDRDEVIYGKYKFMQSPKFPANPFQDSGRIIVDNIEDTVVIDDSLTFYTTNAYGLTVNNGFMGETNMHLMVGNIGGNTLFPKKYYHMFIMPDGKSYIRIGIFNGVEATWTEFIGSNRFTDEQVELLANTSGVNTGDQDLSHLATTGALYSEYQARITADGVLQQQVLALASGSPKGSYLEYQDLVDAYPTGTEGIYVVVTTGNWYYWGGATWDIGGLFQAPLAVVNVTGNDVTKVMNQDIVTKELNKRIAIVDQEFTDEEQEIARNNIGAQSVSDAALQTADKTLVGAINVLHQRTNTLEDSKVYLSENDYQILIDNDLVEPNVEYNVYEE